MIPTPPAAFAAYVAARIALLKAQREALEAYQALRAACDNAMAGPAVSISTAGRSLDTLA